MILALDASTSVVGVCVIDFDKKVHFAGYCDFKQIKDQNLYKKLDILEDYLLNVAKIKEYHITHVSIEQALQMFKTRSSMAGIIAILQRWNGIVCGMLYKMLGHEVQTLNPVSARKLVGIKIQKYSSKSYKKAGIKPPKIDVKKVVFDHIISLNLVPESTWKYKKTGTISETNFDICDAIVIGLATIETLNGIDKKTSIS